MIKINLPLWKYAVLLLALIWLISPFRQETAADVLIPLEGSQNSPSLAQEPASPLPTEVDELVKAFESLIKKQELPPAMGEFMKGFFSLMKEAALGKEQGGLPPERGRILWENFAPLFQKQGLPPEAVDMWKFMQRLMDLKMEPTDKQTWSPGGGTRY